MKTLAKITTIIVGAIGAYVGLSMVAETYGPTVAGAIVLATAFFVGTAATGDL